MKQKIVILALLVVFAAGIAAFTLVYDRAVFDGSRIANSDSCRLDIARMTGSDRHTMEMNAGDTLQVQFETQSGSLHMKINAADGTLLYAGSGKDATSFALNIREGGAYTVAIEARRAKGSIYIQTVTD